MKAVLLAGVFGFASSTVAAPTCTGANSPVSWTSEVNVAASLGVLGKNAGGSSSWNAAASSTQTLAASADPQSVSFKCGMPDVCSGVQMIAGLTNADVGLTEGKGGGVQYGIHCSDCTLKVHESGSNVPGSFGTYSVTDTLKVQVTGTTVEYSKNGVVFHTSGTAATFPLRVDASINDQGNTFTDVTMCSAPPTAAPAPAPTCTETPPSTAAVGSTLHMHATTGPAVAVDLLEDGMHCRSLLYSSSLPIHPPAHPCRHTPLSSPVAFRFLS